MMVALPLTCPPASIPMLTEAYGQSRDVELARSIMSTMRVIRSVDLDGMPVPVLYTVAAEYWERCTIEARGRLVKSAPHVRAAAVISQRLESTRKALREARQ